MRGKGSEWDFGTALFQISLGVRVELSMKLASTLSCATGECIRPQLLLAGGELLLEILEPVFDQDHFGDGRGFPLFVFDHEESLSIVR